MLFPKPLILHINDMFAILIRHWYADESTGDESDHQTIECPSKKVTEKKGGQLMPEVKHCGNLVKGVNST